MITQSKEVPSPTFVAAPPPLPTDEHAVPLTPNAISVLYNWKNRVTGLYSDPTDMNFKPVVQVIHLKKIDMNMMEGPDRWKIVLSDGSCFMSGICSQQINSCVENGIVAPWAIIKLNEFVVNETKCGAIIIVLLKVECVRPPIPDKIGYPIDADGNKCHPIDVASKVAYSVV